MSTKFKAIAEIGIYSLVCVGAGYYGFRSENAQIEMKKEINTLKYDMRKLEGRYRKNETIK